MGTGRQLAIILPEVREAASRGEPDRYLAATLAPLAARPALIAIAAFAAELARIPAVVSEPMLGDIRLQWWRDALAEGRRGGRSGHPVADALSEAVRTHGLAAEPIDAMIDARELDLSGGMPSDDEGLGAYLEATEAVPFRLALAVLGAPSSGAGDLATDAGLAYGIARALGRLPMHVHNGGVVLPAARLRAAGIDPSRLAEHPPSTEVISVVTAVAGDLSGWARQALTRVRGQWRQLPRRAKLALLPLVMVEPYFQAQSGRSLLTDVADVAPLSRVIRIGAAHLTGRL